jgi:hypothetical protein
MNLELFNQMLLLLEFVTVCARNAYFTYVLWGSHSGAYDDYSLMGCDAVYVVTDVSKKHTDPRIEEWNT